MENARAQMRDNMIEQQIRPWDVLDETVLDLYRKIPREEFVPAALRDLAYTDAALPIGFGQTMLEPKLEARMLQTLAPRPHERIFHVGCGSGYFAALLGGLAAETATVEIVPELAAAAAKRLEKYRNITVFTGDGARGAGGGEIFDAVVLTGSTAVIAPEFWQNIKDGGRLVAVVGAPPAMTLALVEKRKPGVLLRRDILETGIPPLQNAPAPPAFEF